MKAKKLFKDTPYKLVDLIVWIVLAGISAFLVFKTGTILSLWNSGGLLFLFILVAIVLALWGFHTVVEKDRKEGSIAGFIRKDNNQEKGSEKSNKDFSNKDSSDSSQSREEAFLHALDD